MEWVRDGKGYDKGNMFNDLSSLLATLLEGTVHPARRDGHWVAMVSSLRIQIRHACALSPGLEQLLSDPDWLAELWTDAIAQAADETGLAGLPAGCPWSLSDQVLTDTWLPG